MIPAWMLSFSSIERILKKNLLVCPGVDEFVSWAVTVDGIDKRR
jgi:hypothetical protein